MSEPEETDETALAKLDATVAGFSRSHRLWVIPILRALEALGGSARPKDVEAKIRATDAQEMSARQWAYVIKGNHVRWARHGLSKEGFVGGKSGTWALTDKGSAYVEAHRDDSLDISSIPELPEDEAGHIGAPLKTVAATAFDGYHIPILRILATGIKKRQEVYAELEVALSDKLLVGDFGVMPQGSVAWTYRAAWALTNLKDKGDARNPSHGMWEITQSGRARLTAEEPTWAIEPFQTSKVKVRLTDASASDAALPSGGPKVASWGALPKLIGKEIHQSLQRRLRPDLGPTPDLSGPAIARNVVLYGPPGTGKTHIATLVAAALTGSKEVGPDSCFRIVQFHPSYSYEDFIQGLRPDLEHTVLRYRLAKGPFLQLCEQAESDPENFYVLVVDEINRGDPARIFGELLYALEYRGAPIDLPTGGQLTVPPNLVIIGTMNSVDRSVALVDYALRRRFGFIRVDPDPDVIRTVRATCHAASIAAEVLDAFNRWMSARLGREHAIGHSFFLNPTVALEDASDLDGVWSLDIEPLLEEYFFGDLDSLGDARKAWESAVREAVTALQDDEDKVTGETA